MNRTGLMTVGALSRRGGIPVKALHGYTDMGPPPGHRQSLPPRASRTATNKGQRVWLPLGRSGDGAGPLASGVSVLEAAPR